RVGRYRPGKLICARFAMWLWTIVRALFRLLFWTGALGRSSSSDMQAGSEIIWLHISQMSEWSFWSEHDAESGRREGCPSRLPHHRTCGSAYGGSWQSLRIEQHSFSATVIAARQLSQSASCLRDKTTDGRVCLPSSALPGLVRPSGVVTGSYLPVLWPLLTPVLARRSSRTAPPFVAE